MNKPIWLAVKHSHPFPENPPCGKCGTTEYTEITTTKDSWCSLTSGPTWHRHKDFWYGPFCGSCHMEVHAMTEYYKRLKALIRWQYQTFIDFLKAKSPN
jgi:hypothetical protein